MQFKLYNELLILTLKKALNFQFYKKKKKYIIRDRKYKVDFQKLILRQVFKSMNLRNALNCTCIILG